MSDHSLDLSLDPYLEHQLVTHLDRQIQLGNFALNHGRVFVIDSSSAVPGGSSLFTELKAKLDPYVDFDAGGLKVVQFKYRGADARFTVVPGWQTSPQDILGKSSGGPSISLKFTMTW